VELINNSVSTIKRSVKIMNGELGGTGKAVAIV
jgi:hypothetical protein